MDLRLELRRTIKLVVPSPKGDLVSVAFLSRHFRAGLWILPSLPGLVCGNDVSAVQTAGRGLGNDLWLGRCEKNRFARVLAILFSIPNACRYPSERL